MERIVRLATIVSIDIVAYSNTAAVDQTVAAAQVGALRRRLEPIVQTHGGRVFSTAGDGFMVEFPAAELAVAAIIDLVDNKQPTDPSIRIGGHLGDVIVEDNNDLLGHGVNVAARLQALAKHDTALVSAHIQNAIRGPLAARLHARGRVQLPKRGETIEAYEIAPGNVFAPPPLITNRRAALAGGSIILAALGAGTWWYTRPSLVSGAGKVRIAVMPFTAAGGDSSQNYLSQGLAEEVMTSLGRIPGVRVAARTSTFATAAAQLTAPLIAQTLGATHILYGLLSTIEGGVRISVRLIDALKTEVIWTADYARAKDQIAGVEDDIANDTAKALFVDASPVGSYPAERPRPEALEYYYRGREAYFRRGDEDVRQSITFLEKAVSIDPRFGKALAALAASYAANINTTAASSQEPIIKLALNLADRALKRDPRLGDAYAVKAQLTPAFRNWQQIDGLLQRGLEIDSENVTLLSLRSEFLQSVGRNNAALAHARNLFTIDPLCPFMTSEFVRALVNTSHMQEASQRFSYADGLWPGHFLFWELRAFYALEGTEEESRVSANFEDVPPEIHAQLDPSLFAAAQLAEHFHERRPQAEQKIAASAGLGQDSAHRAIRLLCDIARPESALPIAKVLLADKGFVDPSHGAIYPPWPNREVWPIHVFSPPAANLRALPGFGAIIQSIGLVDYWASHGVPDGCDGSAAARCAPLLQKA